MDLNLKEKIAFVCGGTQGIGFAIANELAGMGAAIVLVARNEESLKTAAEKLNAVNGLDNNYICADFDQPMELSAAVRQYLQSHTSPHILINNSGGPPGGPITQARLEEFEVTFRRHLECNHVMVQACLQGMESYGYGRIINIISTSVKEPLRGLGVSNTIRSAVAAWAKTLSKEVAASGITVNNVLPGATMTGRLSGIIKARSEKQGKSEQEVSDEMLAEIPAARFAAPEEVAAAVAFFASPAAGYITGTSLQVDGGRVNSI